MYFQGYLLLADFVRAINVQAQRERRPFARAKGPDKASNYVALILCKFRESAATEVAASSAAIIFSREQK